MLRGVTDFFNHLNDRLFPQDLHEAIQKGNYDRVQEIILADPSKVNQQFSSYDLPFSTAVGRKKCFKIAVFLLDQGADPTLPREPVAGSSDSAARDTTALGYCNGAVPARPVLILTLFHPNSYAKTIRHFINRQTIGSDRLDRENLSAYRRAVAYANALKLEDYSRVIEILDDQIKESQGAKEDFSRRKLHSSPEQLPGIELAIENLEGLDEYLKELKLSYEKKLNPDIAAVRVERGSSDERPVTVPSAKQSSESSEGDPLLGDGLRRRKLGRGSSEGDS